MPGTAPTEHAPAIRALAGRWFAAVADDPAVRGAGGDFVCSPAGLWLTLAVAAVGARAGTAAELSDLLGPTGPDAAATATGAAALLAETDALEVATGVWARTPLYRAFRESLPGVDFAPAGPDADLDAWVRRATRGLVDGLSAPPEPDAQLLLVNALGLVSPWENRFETRNTRERPFTDADGTEYGVQTMFKRMPHPNHAWTVLGGSKDPDDAVVVAAMRCRAEYGGTAAQVRFVLGAPGRPAEAVLPAAWAPPEQRQLFDVERVTLALPRLLLRSQLDVARQLETLGVVEARSTRADFSGMSPEELRIGPVTQQCLLRVTELGVEAAAVTEMTFSTRSASTAVRTRHLAFDRPFGIVVLDGSGAVPLFTAWQSTAPRTY